MFQSVRIASKLATLPRSIANSAFGDGCGMASARPSMTGVGAGRFGWVAGIAASAVADAGSDDWVAAGARCCERAVGTKRGSE